MKQNILKDVKASVGLLSPSETRVACLVLVKPEGIVAMSIGAVAQEAKVSEPTVMRFCRSLGCKGFQAFKNAIGSALEGGEGNLSLSIGPDDSTETMIGKIGYCLSESIKEIIDSVDVGIVEKAVHCLSVAKRIQIYGSGGSGLVAHAAQYSFLLCRLSSTVYVDPQLQMMAAEFLDAKSVVIAISWSGESEGVVIAAGQAKEQGATVIGITNPYSSLAKISDLVLATAMEADSAILSLMTTRLYQQTIFDILIARLKMIECFYVP